MMLIRDSRAAQYCGEENTGESGGTYREFAGGVGLRGVVEVHLGGGRSPDYEGAESGS